MRVLVTGASGFVGRMVVRGLADRGEFRPRAAYRRPVAAQVPGVEQVIAPDLSSTSDWRPVLRDCRAVVHSAARVHVLRDRASDPLSEFRAVNVTGTLALARAAADVGATRFVFISSVKVNGEGTRADQPYTADDPPAPVDAYGRSKLEAELGLRDLARETGLEVTIIRPVLVYGPGVRANFQTMMRWLYRGVPLPFGAVNNRRSIVAIDNLVDLIRTCLTHPCAPNETFLVSDGEDLSTPELLRRTAFALGCRAHLVRVPPLLLRSVAELIGRGELARRLCTSLQVDIQKTRDLLGWSPKARVDEVLSRTAAGFLEAESR